MITYIHPHIHINICIYIYVYIFYRFTGAMKHWMGAL